MFHERLTQILDERGISAYRVYKDTGLSQTVLSKWKSGTQIPTADKLAILADYLNVSMDYLMCRTDRPELHIQKVDTEKGVAELRVSQPLTPEEIEKFREMLKGM